VLAIHVLKIFLCTSIIRTYYISSCVCVCVCVYNTPTLHIRISPSALHFLHEPALTSTLPRRCLWGKPYRKARVPRAIYILRPNDGGGRSGKHNEPPPLHTHTHTRPHAHSQAHVLPIIHTYII